MVDTITQLLSHGLLPREDLHLWPPELLWIQALAEGVFAATYLLLPMALMATAMRRRQVLPRARLLALFGCVGLVAGCMHFAGIWTYWEPAMGIEGVARLATAIAMLAAGTVFVVHFPDAPLASTSAEVVRFEKRVEEEVARREAAEAALEAANQAFDQRIEERMADLRSANTRLEEEIRAHRSTELRLHQLAQHDALTQLPTRHLFQEQLLRKLVQSRQDRKLTAVMLIDLDSFKHVNESLGHAAGDLLIRDVASRLRRTVRNGDTVARLGGDEFAIVQDNVLAPEDVVALARRVVEAFGQAFELEGREVFTAASIGIAVFPDDGEDHDRLMAAADLALQRSKRVGRGSYEFFSPEMAESDRSRRALEADLRRALDAGAFALHFQPIIDLRADRICAAEALVRWHHPERGLVPPAQFIAVAESIGLIRPLGDWVLRTACRQAAAWRARGADIAVSVNVSAVQLTGQDLAAQVADALAESGLPAPHLHLELTESVLFDGEAVTPTLERIAGHGVGLAIDDFGTGFSSLSYINRLPVDRIKIDRSFVFGIGAGEGSEAIVDAVIGLGRSLDKRIVAEGVENQDQLAFLRAYGCDEVQGYLFSRPLPASDFELMLFEGELERAS